MKNYFIIIVSLVYFIALRSIGLSENFFFDYDAVKNYMIAQEIAKQDYSSLFHHGAPLMNFFHGIIFTIIKDKIFYIPIIIESIGLIILLHTIFISLKIKDFKVIILSILITGSSFLLVNSGRYFSLEPYSVLFFSIWFYYYSLKPKQKTHLWLLGLLILINYKMIILLPYCILNDYKTNNRTLKEYWKYIIPAWIIPFTMALSLVTHQNSLTYIKTLFALYFLRNETVIFNQTTFSFSLGFYTKYLFYFEHPIILAGIFFTTFTIIKSIKTNCEIETTDSLPIYILIIMIFLPGAPRAILIAIPFLCVTGVMAFNHLIISLKINAKLLYIVLATTVIYPIYILYNNLYSKTASNYESIATYINKNNIQLLYTTSGIGIQPFLKNTRTIVLQREAECKQIPVGAYLLLDSEALINGWEKLPQGKCIIASSNICKTQLMLGLENAEYSGLNFNQIIEANNKIIHLKKSQLCLIKTED